MAEIESTLSGTLNRTVEGDVTRLSARGAWVIDTAEALDPVADRAAREVGGRVVLDLSGVSHIDTSGAWLITRIGARLAERGATVEFTGMSENARRLIAAVEPAQHIAVAEPPPRHLVLQLLEALGRSTVNARNDLVQALGILGGVVRGLVRGIRHPSRFRFTSIVFHIDRAGLQAVPIIALISLLIGGIVSQQGVFQLSFFGAEDFVVDLVGILVLRELGVLLTAIMLAGRSGSAYTAEIGSMKMREEIDALTVLGVSPADVLVVPRLLALVLVLPILTLVSNLAALTGAFIVVVNYVGLPPDTFFERLREALTVTNLVVGFSKAPAMAVVIGLIACVEGLKVEGSAESLGSHTTASVVKAIFLVIVMDGVFAMIFASVDI